MAGSAACEDLGLSIIGLGTQYPPHSLKPDSLETLSKKFYPDSASMQKVLSINRYTGIDARSSIGTPDHPLVNQAAAPSITEVHSMFMSHGVPLAVGAAQKAIAEAHIELSQITHMVSTTCTDSANPGYDHFVAKGLGIDHAIEKVLLHGVGCSGGLAALRTAASLALAYRARRKPARILVVALEISTTMVRSELDSINEKQECRIGVALFSDCAGALVLSNGVGDGPEPVYDLLGWEHRILPDTEEDLGFDVDPLGWKVVLSPRVPKLAGAALQPAYAALLASTVPPLPPTYQAAADFDWAMHPGGATILSGAERAMGITPEHMRASYDTYINHGNSSSATVLSVLDRLRQKDMDGLAPGGRVRDYIVGCAFGPGIAVEMCMLKRNLAGGGRGASSAALTGLLTPPETESEASSNRSDDGNHEEEDGREVDEEHRPEWQDGKAPADPAGQPQLPESKDGQQVDAEKFVVEALAEIDLD